MQKKIIIRQIIQEDNLPVAKMIREVFEEHDAPRKGTIYSDPSTNDLYKLFQISKSVLWIAEIDNMIIGCCGVYPTEGLNKGCAELVKFYIHQNSRGRGIGKELMEQCTRSAIEFGYNKLYLESLPQFSKAISIYEKQGFQKLDQPLGNSGHNACNIWMTKELL